MFMNRVRRIVLPVLLVSFWTASPALADDRDPFDIVNAGTRWTEEASEQVSGWVSLIVQFFSDEVTDPGATPNVVIPKPPPPGDGGNEY